MWGYPSVCSGCNAKIAASRRDAPPLWFECAGPDETRRLWHFECHPLIRRTTPDSSLPVTGESETEEDAA